MMSENTIGVLDHENVFHVFHPDGGYRNMSVENVTTSPITAAHFSVPAKQLVVGHVDGTLVVHRTDSLFIHVFEKGLRDIYADENKYMLFMENGEMVMGDIQPSLPETTRWKHVFDGSTMHRYTYHDPYFVVDGDQDGFTVRGYKPFPLDKKWTIKKSPDRSDLDEFLHRSIQKYKNHTSSGTDNSTSLT